MMRRHLSSLGPWLFVFGLAGVLSACTTAEAFRRYELLQSGWSWDLAYYNQWFWALVFGDRTITVNPGSPYAFEGPSIWHANYLAVGRLLIAPFYALAPGPRTLLAIHAVVFWWVVPAAYSLVRSETGSPRVALVGACLVPLTPLLWPLAINDFRELQMGIPFVLWCVQGVRGRDVRLTVLAATALLLCRQEFALMLASFAVIPPRDREDPGRTYRWAHTLVFVGLAWFLFAFFLYLSYVIGEHSPRAYVAQFGGSPATASQIAETMFETWLLGLGAFALFGLFAPRMMLVILPWLYSISAGRWAMWVLTTGSWHHVRYTAPAVATGLAVGLVGFGRAWLWARERRFDRAWLVVVAILAAEISGLSLGHVVRLCRLQPILVTEDEARDLREWMDRVEPEDGVLATYYVCAPLSTRRVCYSYIGPFNRPKGYPRLSDEIGWVFFRPKDRIPLDFVGQEFREIYRGAEILVFRRVSPSPSTGSK